ncbi:MAG: DUF2892 domain-containing protein [OCS116 cluster bacterium]|uniref:Inner membrane protein YgaP-like transmembrane domain-containing protein n=1 Tax=OCS116 cluster bacterium TaxID=2030921 RepID=A0A2A4Z226_9PROT|nr:DUF2892 domain-containing protein [OCS116 cluster bacterium]
MKNLGSPDKMIRFVIAIVAAIAAYMYMATLGIWFWVLIAVAVIMAGTALLNFCPLYAIFGIKTCKTE